MGRIFKRYLIYLILVSVSSKLVIHNIQLADMSSLCICQYIWNKRLTVNIWRVLRHSGPFQQDIWSSYASVVQWHCMWVELQLFHRSPLFSCRTYGSSRTSNSGILFTWHELQYYLYSFMWASEDVESVCQMGAVTIHWDESKAVYGAYFTVSNGVSGRGKCLIWTHCYWRWIIDPLLDTGD